jgi:hypothetical protein
MTLREALAQRAFHDAYGRRDERIKRCPKSARRGRER